jgi:hypothetical protein
MAERQARARTRKGSKRTRDETAAFRRKEAERVAAIRKKKKEENISTNTINLKISLRNVVFTQLLAPVCKRRGGQGVHAAREGGAGAHRKENRSAAMTEKAAAGGGAPKISCSVHARAFEEEHPRVHARACE